MRFSIVNSYRTILPNIDMSDDKDQEMMDQNRSRRRSDDSPLFRWYEFICELPEMLQADYQFFQSHPMFRKLFFDKLARLSGQRRSDDFAERQCSESLDQGRLEDEIIALQRRNASLEEQVLGQDAEIRNLHRKISSKDSSSKELDHSNFVSRSRYEASAIAYKQDLSEKMQENRKLHAIIVQSRQESDPYDDQHFTTEFRALETKVEHLVKKHFPATQATIEWKAYDDVKASDDRDFFLQAYIAKEIARGFFSPDARLFGLDEKTEEYQAAFERLLQSCNVPRTNVADWRIQTIKVANLVKNKDHNYRTINVYQELSKYLKDVHPHGEDWSSAKKSLQELCRFAFDLAVSLRSCRAEYMWNQEAQPASLSMTDIDLIENYNVGAKGPTNKPTKIMFGPVYKLVDGLPILLKSGTVLCS